MGAPVILITGALTGIGRTTAFAFAKEGATVVASGRLASDKASFVTGQIIRINGGKTATWSLAAS
jgi:NAD(P)-dependent dehydrogenase (short-subunit alcohol dehydrogenase family)